MLLERHCMGLDVFAVEALRFLRICSYADFVFVKTRKTAKVSIERGYSKIDLCKSVSNMFCKHSISCLSSMFSR